MTKALLLLPCSVLALYAQATCAANAPAQGPDWQGWGGDNSNRRYTTADGIADPSKLTLKWAFGAPGARQLGPPSLNAGRLYIASDTGEVYSLDPSTGCVHWTYKADAGVRTAIVFGPATGQRTGAYFGDQRGKAYAVDAISGQLLWKTQLDDHASAKITGAPIVHQDRVYFPVSSGEEGAGASPSYACCTFRGSLVALTTGSGRILWKTYTIPEPPGRIAENKFAPSGAAVWSPPTLDVKRGAIYVATGDAYSKPAADTTDAILAIELASGKILWHTQLTKDDVWLSSCMRPNAPPDDCGPDHDFGSPAALVTVAGRDLLVAGQKSGNVWALDPDNKGAIVWRSPLVANTEEFGGKIVWGGAVDNDTAYYGLGPGGIGAVNLRNGERKWFTDIPPAEAMRTHPGHDGPVIATANAIYSGGWDGVLRALSPRDGRVIWEFNTARTFDTVNGVPGKGGSIGAAGPIAAGGFLYVTSGYAGVRRGETGNVLLAFRAQ